MIISDSPSFTSKLIIPLDKGAQNVPHPVNKILDMIRKTPNKPAIPAGFHTSYIEIPNPPKTLLPELSKNGIKFNFTI